MDEQTLYQLVFKTGKTKTIVSAIEKLTDKQKSELSKLATELINKFCHYIDYLQKKKSEKRAGNSARANKLETESPTIIELAKDYKINLTDTNLIKHEKRYRHNAILIAFTFSSLTTINTILRETYWLDFKDDCLVRVLATRKKSFVDRWVAAQLKLKDFNPLMGFSFIHTLVKRKACNKPPAELLIPLLVEGARREAKETFINREISLSDYFKNNPELLKTEFWKIFTLDTRAFSHDDYETEKVEIYQSWRQATMALYEQGHLHRVKLLSALLNAIHVNSNTRAIDNMMKFYNELKPEPKETAKNKQAILGFLSHEMDAGVRAGVKLIQGLCQYQLLKPGELLDKAVPVFNLKAKAQPMITLKLLEPMTLVISTDSKDYRPLLTLLINAITHPNEDVQEKALDMIERCLLAGDQTSNKKISIDTESINKELGSVINTVNAKIQQRIKKLLNSSTGKSGNKETVNWLQLNEQIENLTPQQKQLTGLNAINTVHRNNYSDQLKKIIKSKPVVQYNSPCFCAPDHLDTTHDITGTMLKNTDEVLASIAKLVESCEDAHDIEQVLNGISRFSSQDINELALKSKPLLMRMDKLIYAWREASLLGEDPMGSLFHKLFVTWLGAEIEAKKEDEELILTETLTEDREVTQFVRDGYVYKKTKSYKNDEPIIEVIKLRKYQEKKEEESERRVNTAYSLTEGRLNEIIDRGKQGIQAPLLSSPTHSGGWIDTRQLSNRIQYYEKHNISVGTYDFLQTLLRLAVSKPGDSNTEQAQRYREESIELLKQCNSIHAKIIRFAIGDNIKPDNKDESLLPLWLTAARIRHPNESSEKYFTDIKGISSICTGITKPEHIDYKMSSEKYSGYSIDRISISERETMREIVSGRFVSYFTTGDDKTPLEYRALIPILKKVTTPAFVQNNDDYIGLLPTLVCFDGEQETGLGTGQWGIRWHAMIWPSNNEYFYIGGLRSIIFRMDDNAAASEPNFIYLEPLFNQEMPLIRPAMITLMLALNSKDQDIHRLAIDLLIELIQDSRINSELLYKYCKELTDTGVIKANRLGAALQEVASVSALHGNLVGEAMEKYFIAVDTYPRSSHIMLQGLRDNLIMAQRVPTKTLIDKLKTIKGTSKLAKLAKEIIALENRSGQETSPVYEQVVYELIKQRVEIANNQL